MYQRIIEQLREAINANSFPTGRLPTERVLSVRYDVSIGTIRRSLSMLKQEGLITQRRGSGTYVQRQMKRRSLTGSKRTHLICYLSGTGTENVLGSFFNRLLIAVQYEVDRRGYATVLATAHDGKVPMPVSQQKVDGVIVAGTYVSPNVKGVFTEQSIRENNEFIARVADTGVPIVGISNVTDRQAIPVVMPTYDDVIAEALAHLKEVGHTSVAVFGGPRTWPAFGQRIATFQRQAQKLNMDHGEHLVCPYQTWAYLAPQAAREAVRSYMRSGSPATAGIVIAGAPGLVQQGLADVGIRAPEEFSLISFADTPRASDGRPLFLDTDTEIPIGMATFDMPVEKIARAAVERMLQILDGHDSPPEQRNISISPIYTRECSVGAPNRHFPPRPK